MLETPDPPTGENLAAMNAAAALATAVGDDEVYHRVEELYEQRPKDRHRHLLCLLCEVRPAAADEWLGRALRSRDKHLRRRACSHAWYRDNTPPLDACMAAVNTKLEAGARAMIGALALKHGDAGREALERVLQSGAPYQRVTAALGLATTGHSGAFEVLKNELTSSRRHHRWTYQVSRILCRHYPEEVRQWIEREAGSLTRAHSAAWTLVRSGQAVAGNALETLYRNGTPAVRAAALRVLVQCRGAAMVGELREHLRERRPTKVARIAFKALRRLRPEAESVVRDMLDSEHWTEREAAVGILRCWGEFSPALRAKATADPHPAVRISAAS